MKKVHNIVLPPKYNKFAVSTYYAAYNLASIFVFQLPVTRDGPTTFEM
jgi:hypothetical protein